MTDETPRSLSRRNMLRLTAGPAAWCAPGPLSELSVARGGWSQRRS